MTERIFKAVSLDEHKCSAFKALSVTLTTFYTSMVLCLGLYLGLEEGASNTSCEHSVITVLFDCMPKSWRTPILSAFEAGR